MRNIPLACRFFVMPHKFTAGKSALLRAFAAFVFCVFAMDADALSFSNRYRSPRNAERQIRKSTKVIVLHTTEAGARSSLNKLSERGEAHYCIDEKGVVHRIVDRNREAFHAGRSMWGGKEECDSYSIGIEVVGHHDKPVTLYQIDAIRELLATLKKEYRIDDAHVLCHSHVAYGAPNKWQKRNHRGRKRCGMLFAMSSVRSRIGLKSKPAYDPDVRAKRLVVGDAYLEKVLYGKVDTMVGAYKKNAAPKPKEGLFASLFTKRDPDMANEPEKENYYEKPKAALTAAAPAKPEVKKRYVSAASAKSAEKKPKPAAPKPKAVLDSAKKEPLVLADLEDRVKFREIGVMKKGSSPYGVAGRAWNSPSTYYYYKGKVTRGDRLSVKKAVPGMRVFVRK